MEIAVSSLAYLLILLADKGTAIRRGVFANKHNVVWSGITGTAIRRGGFANKHNVVWSGITSVLFDGISFPLDKRVQTVQPLDEETTHISSGTMSHKVLSTTDHTKTMDSTAIQWHNNQTTHGPSVDSVQFVNGIGGSGTMSHGVLDTTDHTKTMDSTAIQWHNDQTTHSVDSVQFVNETGGAAANEGSKGKKYYRRICWLPPFLMKDRCRAANKAQPIPKECEIPGGKAAFAAMIAVIGIAVVIGNSIVPIALVFDKSYRTRHNYIKGSLAIVDMLVGWYMLCCVMPNLSWVGSVTERQLLLNVIRSKNSPRSITLGSFLLLTTQVSTLHLLMLSVERFSAVTWPFWHRRLRFRTAFIFIGIIWALAIFEALLPAFLHRHFEYQFHPLFLVYFLMVKRIPGGPNTHGAIYAATTIGIPYLLTVGVSIGAAVNVWRHFRKKNAVDLVPLWACDADTTTSSRLRRNQAENNHLKPEIAVLKTTFYIISAFSLSLVPVTVVFFLAMVGYYGCSSSSLPYFAAFYLKILSSLFNVMIYSVRDKNLRDALKKMWTRIPNPTTLVFTQRQTTSM